MDLFNALGEGIRESFSTARATIPQALLYGQDAARDLAEAFRDHVAETRRVTVLFDSRTGAAAAEPCLAAFADAGFAVTELLIPDSANPDSANPDAGKGSSPVCDDLTKDALLARLEPTDALLAVGSGVVNDLSKWLAALKEIPYAVFATAASMNGYAAANVAPSIGGVKSLFRARAPRIVAADPRVVAAAPFVLTTAGLGDVIAKPMSTSDWLVNHILFDEPFSEPVAAVIDRVEPSYVGNPAGIANKAPEAIEALFEALVYSGCAMTLIGSSMPASGGEHLISHTLDMTAEHLGIPHDLHGRQVGVATIFAAAIYQRIVALESPRFGQNTVPFEASVWGPLAAAVEPEHAKKQRRMVQASEALAAPGCWDVVRERISGGLREPAAVKACLRDAGAAHRYEDIGCDRERFLMAVRNAGAMRGRFTCIDLAHAVGLLPDCAPDIVDEWLS